MSHYIKLLNKTTQFPSRYLTMTLIVTAHEHLLQGRHKSCLNRSETRTDRIYDVKQIAMLSP